MAEIDYDVQETNEFIRDLFNRALTYYTFHIGLNYLVLGWLATSTARLPSRAVWFLAIIFIFHNIAAMVSYSAVAFWLKGALVQARLSYVRKPPYFIGTVMMLVTLVNMIVIWLIAPFVL